MAGDPYRYFRVEAGELLAGLGEGVGRLGRGEVDADLVTRLLRQAHTLKGAARVVRQPAIAEIAHALEDLLAGGRSGAGPLPRAQADQALRLIDQAGEQLRQLATPAAPGPVSPAAMTSPEEGQPVTAVPAPATAERPHLPPPPTDDAVTSVRVDMADMDALLHGVVEARIRLGALRGEAAAVAGLRALAGRLRTQLARAGGAAAAGALADQLTAGLERHQNAVAGAATAVADDLDGLAESAQRLRLVPAATVFPDLARVAREAGEALGRRLDVATADSGARLDAAVLAALREALGHVVRNAVVHGVEDAAARRAAGKPAVAQVLLAVDHHGDQVTFRCRDDGRGFDLAAVRAAAVARGRCSAAQAAALSDQETIDLLLAGGLTTAGAVSELAGRGIGLDLARATASRLKGALTVHSRPGQGAEVAIRVPVSIAALPALTVEAAGVALAIPLAAVVATMLVPVDAVAHAGGRDAVLHDGRSIPFLPLARALRRERPAPRRRAWSVVVLRAGDRLAAVGADRVLGIATVVARPLPALVAADAVVAGAALDAAGDAQLVLDPVGLAAAAERGGGTGVAPAPAAPAPPILIIDDSLTTRMLEQSILESAGYTVELAVSAVEGLARARERRYRLFVVDVEMPGMDGFEFVERTRADPVLRDIPAILVTSRAAPEDRRRGLAAGASVYIDKGEFDQDHLLAAIRGLVG